MFFFFLQTQTCNAKEKPHGIELKYLIKKWVFCLVFMFTSRVRVINPVQDGLFEAAHGWGGRSPLLHKICLTYPTIMKLGTLTHYLEKIEKIYKSRNIPLEFC